MGESKRGGAPDAHGLTLLPRVPLCSIASPPGLGPVDPSREGLGFETCAPEGAVCLVGGISPKDPASGSFRGVSLDSGLPQPTR